MKKVSILLVMLLLLTCIISACKEEPSIQKTEEVVSEDVASNEQEQQQNEDDVEINNNLDKKAILVVSFGTSYNDTRALTIDATEQYIAEKYPEYDVKRAFTSQIIIDKLADRDGLDINNMQEAMENLKSEGYSDVIIQPLHIINGFEYDEVVNEAKNYAGDFNSLIIGKPILTEHEDYVGVIEALAKSMPEVKENEAIVLMGHGTEHDANAAYGCLDETFKDLGYSNVFVGTVEGFPTLETVQKKLEEKEIDKVTLMPFMVVAGDHANNDMAGDEEDSWKIILKSEGYDVECILQGLGELTEIRELYVKHIKEAIEGKGTIIEPLEASEGQLGQKDSEKKALLVISFGTSYNDTRALTIDATEEYLQNEFPEYELKRAFTSQIIIDKLAKRDGLIIDNVTQALTKLKEEGYSEVIAQPLHVINGYEYDDVVAELEKYKNDFDKLELGKPVLTEHEDYINVVETLVDNMPELKENEALVFMGHGTEHDANAAYSCLNYTFNDEGIKNVYIGTVEGYPTIENVMDDLETDGIEKVILMPLMVVAGDHANNDMAGDEEDSWKIILKSAGYDVECELKGLGEMEGIRKIYAKHIEEAIEGGESN